MKLERKIWVPLIITGLVVALVVTIMSLKWSGGIKSNNAPAVADTPVTANVYQYTSDVITSLGYANEAKNILSAMNEETSGDIYSTTMDTLITSRKAISKLQQAANFLNAYSSTANEMINDNSQNYRMTYETLAILLETGAKQNERLLKSQDESGLADFISESSKTIVDLDDTWKVLPLLSVELGYVLIDSDRLVDDKLTYLRITSSERKELIKSLDDTFGDEIKSGLKTGQLAVVAAGSLLREFLTSEWKSSDE